MQFTTSVRALLLLAAEPDKLHKSEDVAERIGANPVVLRRLFSQLQEAGLVRSQKGPGGGSKLAREAQAITLRDVYQAVDPQPLVASSANGGKAQSSLKTILTSASRAFEDELSRTTLADLAQKTGRNTRE